MAAWGWAMTPEQRAREIITQMLDTAGWRYREEALTGRRSGSGFADYLLFDADGTAVGLVEAKPAGTPALAGKEQAREYADSIGVQHVLLSNGNAHFHWVAGLGHPVPILEFPVPGELDQVREGITIDRSPLWNIVVDENFMRTRPMRYYQVDAVRSLQESAMAGHLGFLLEMATGTGKTTVAAAICRLYLQAEVAQRILFLVDRDELYTQAIEDLNQALDGQYRVGGYRDRERRWSSPITVATVQALNAATAQGEAIPADWFQLVISDEAHRSISGPRHRDVFDAFNCDKVGLTATPRQYLSIGNPDDTISVAGREAKALRDTYYAFGLTPGEPTFEYTIQQAADDGYLVMPHALDVRTEVTAQLMSDEGFQMTVEDYESGDEVVVEFHESDYGRRFISPDTNREFAEQYIEHALREPEIDIIGKGIIYCVTRGQAAELTNQLNIAAGATWPGIYQSDFAVQITHDVDRATEMGRAFRNPDGLNGTDPTDAGYKTSKTRVCVTVAMMTTGYDCPDLLNLAFCRPVKSPTDYIQMKGRGTRKYEFKENFTDQLVRDQLNSRPKEQFRIIDFFGVCEYFGEADLYNDELLRAPRNNGGGPPPGGPIDPRVPVQPYINYGDDDTESITGLELAADGAIITREAVLEQRENSNQALAQEFERYLEIHPVPDPFEREEVKLLFEAYATDEDTRNAIDNRLFGTLSGALTAQRYSRIPQEHRGAVVDYIRNLNQQTS